MNNHNFSLNGKMNDRANGYVNGHTNGYVNGHIEEESRPRPQGAMASDYVWLDGELVPFEQATVHFLTPTLHYGAGVFEGIRCYATARGPAIFRLQAHLERFLDSIRILGFNDLPYSLDELRIAVHSTIEANGFSECYIRPMMYLEGSLGLDLHNLRPVIGIAAWRWGNFLGEEAMENGIRAMVSSFTRMNPNAGMTKAKISGQYVNSMLAKTMALRAGFDEAIMLDPEGYLAECTGENLFMVRDEIIYTPSTAAIMEGITRDAVFTLAADAGYRVMETRLSRDQLYTADELFVCGTAAELAPVREVDHRRIGDGVMGPVTRLLQQQFLDVVRGRGRRSQEWLDYVMMQPLF